MRSWPPEIPNQKSNHDSKDILEHRYSILDCSITRIQKTPDWPSVVASTFTWTVLTASRDLVLLVQGDVALHIVHGCAPSWPTFSLPYSLAISDGTVVVVQISAGAMSEATAWSIIFPIGSVDTTQVSRRFVLLFSGRCLQNYICNNDDNTDCWYNRSLDDVCWWWLFVDMIDCFDVGCLSGQLINIFELSPWIF